jgi:hypothetical protein
MTIDMTINMTTNMTTNIILTPSVNRRFAGRSTIFPPPKSEVWTEAPPFLPGEGPPYNLLASRGLAERIWGISYFTESQTPLRLMPMTLSQSVSA